MKKYYANNAHRKLLTPSEKKRYNAYKKRECERRRRYKRKGKTDHPCFYSYRCEACRTFFEEEDNVLLLFGYSICKRCLIETSKTERFLRQSSFDYSQHTETLENVSMSLQSQDDDTYNANKPLSQSEKIVYKKDQDDKKNELRKENAPNNPTHSDYLLAELMCHQIRVYATYENRLREEMFDGNIVGSYCFSWIND